jgi:signal transduction histidine kinase
MKKSIYFRSFGLTFGIILLSLSLLVGMFFMWSYHLILSQRQSVMSTAAREAQRYVSAQFPYQGRDLGGFEIRMIISMISRISGFDIILTDSEGSVVSTSENSQSSPLLGKTVPETSLGQVLSGDNFKTAGHLGGLYAEPRYIIGVPVTHAQNDGVYVYGFLFLSAVSDTTVDVWRQFSKVFLLITVLDIILTCLITLFSAKKQTQPIGEMARAATRFASGDFSVRVRDTRRLDEIGDLTRAFNAMAEALERSEKLRREFIANISHELKTPMTVMAGFADGILDGTIPPEREENYIAIISSETKRLSRLVRSMLEMSRFQALEEDAVLSESFDVTEVLRRVLAGLYGKTEEKGITLDAQIPEEELRVRGDGDSITQVVYNLTDNAIKFAATGSVVAVALWKRGGAVFVSVQNTGETIPQEELPQIFDRFHKADGSRSSDRDGVGLGLYIAKTILDKHGEQIFVTSKDGVTKFEFTLSIAA